MKREGFVWIMRESREILLTDDPSPPVGGTFVGSYVMPWMGWGKAGQVAELEAQQLGFELTYDSRFI